MAVALGFGLIAACFSYLSLIADSVNSTAALIVENHINSEEWWVAFYVDGIDSLDCGVEIAAIEITDHSNYLGQWVPHSADDLGHRWSFNTQGKAFTPPLSLRITAANNATTPMNETFYACDVITSFEPAQQFALNVDLCDTTESYANVSCSSDDGEVDDDGTEPNVGADVLIENHVSTEPWWVAFYVHNIEQLPCDISLIGVEITDNAYYRQRWIAFDEEAAAHQWAFLNQGNAYTLPLSLRMTTETSGGIHSMFYACDVITSFEGSKRFNLSLDLCNLSLADDQLVNHCWGSQIITTSTADETTEGTDERRSTDGVVVAATLSSTIVASFVICLMVYLCRRRNARASSSNANSGDDHEMAAMQPGMGRYAANEDASGMLPKAYTITALTNEPEGIALDNIREIGSLNLEGFEKQNITAHTDNEDDFKNAEAALPFSPSGSSALYANYFVAQVQPDEAQFARSPSGSSGMYDQPQPKETECDDQPLQEIAVIHIAPSKSAESD